MLCESLKKAGVRPLPVEEECLRAKEEQAQVFLLGGTEKTTEMRGISVGLLR